MSGALYFGGVRSCSLLGTNSVIFLSGEAVILFCWPIWTNFLKCFAFQPQISVINVVSNLL